MAAKRVKIILFLHILAAAMAVFHLGCAPAQQQNQQLIESDRVAASDNRPLRILFLGNSHTAMHNVPELVKTLIDAAGNHGQVTVESTIGGFLEFLAGDPAVEKQIRTGNWDYVVMQGQKISMSGRFIYSTKEAEGLSAIANQSGAKVVWYAEWARLGVDGERQRIEDIYGQISSVNNDIVCPVGRVWENAQAKQKDIELHSPDGNHANPLGASLAALTLYSTITGSDCRDLPTIKSTEFGDDVQTFLKLVVWETLKEESNSTDRGEHAPASSHLLSPKTGQTTDEH